MHQHTSLRWILLTAALTLPCLLGNKGCDDQPKTADGGTLPAGACTPKECGPAPGAPNFMCSDGTVGGPGACGRLSNGECGYAWHDCPPANDSGTEKGDASAPDASVGLACGTRGGVACTDGEFCNFEPDADCGGTDRGGACEQIPTTCTRLYKPVCGCDAKTYPNACSAHSAGAAVLHEGACTEIDCKRIGGHPVDGIGPPPKCPNDEVNFTSLVYSNGNISTEGTACCVPARGP